MPGCACDPPARSLDGCKCKAKPILEEIGGCLRYSMKKLQKEDLEWFTNILGGSEWLILSSHMAIEDPSAAHTTALALNKRNKVALATGHMDIMKTQPSLLQTSPPKNGGSVGSSTGPDGEDFRPSLCGGALLQCFSFDDHSGRPNERELEGLFPMGGLFRRRISAPDPTRILLYPCPIFVCVS